MPSPITKSPSRGRKLTLWAALSVAGVLPQVGCQVEYAGMTLPSGKYMHDDVQYFAPGPHFPYANTQAATQRAQMQAQGVTIAAPNPGVATPTPAAGAADPANINQSGSMVPNTNVQLNPPGGADLPVNDPGVRGNVPAPPPPGGDGGVDAMPR